jgi:UV DNA damage endonuclease
MLRSLTRIPFRIAQRVPERASFALQSPRTPFSLSNMAKRKRSTAVDASPSATDAPVVDRSKLRRSEVPLPPNGVDAPKVTRRQSSRGTGAATTNPDLNPDIMDGVTALRASPDAEAHADVQTSNSVVNGVDQATDTTSEIAPTTAPDTKGKRGKAAATKVKVEPEESSAGVVKSASKTVAAPTKNAESNSMDGDPEGAEDMEDDEVEVKEALSRPPPVNSEYLPLPWKGRLGYVSNRRQL